MAEAKRTLEDVVRDIREKAYELESAAMSLASQAADRLFTESDKQREVFERSVAHATEMAHDLDTLTDEYYAMKGEQDG